jgi:hypothetical protein
MKYYTVVIGALESVFVTVQHFDYRPLDIKPSGNNFFHFYSYFKRGFILLFTFFVFLLFFSHFFSFLSHYAVKYYTVVIGALASVFVTV